MKGTRHFANPDTMEWKMTKCMGLFNMTKVMDMKGTAKRVK
jgi:hypothetical protein